MCTCVGPVLAQLGPVGSLAPYTPYFAAYPIMHLPAQAPSSPSWALTAAFLAAKFLIAHMPYFSTSALDSADEVLSASKTTGSGDKQVDQMKLRQ